AVADGVVVLDDLAQRRQREEMRHDRRAVLATKVEDEPRAVDAQVQRIGAGVVAVGREAVLLQEVVDRDRTLVLDVRVGAADRILVERDRHEAIGLWLGRAAHGGCKRMGTERAWAWASSPWASPRAIGAPPSWRSCSGPQLRIEVRFMKSSTPSPEEKRAERAVGSTWLEPPT